jgi:hydroxymethylpyrimidine/phosphomethylpyrimidine kinase
MCTPNHLILCCIGGKDPTGGAGLDADERAAQALGVEPLLIETARTDQDEAGVHDLGARPVAEVRAALHRASEAGPAVWKIGMLATEAILREVWRVLRSGAQQAPIVLDPVLHASAGGALLEEDASGALTQLLLPLASVVTPNLVEAATLLGEDDVAASAATARGIVDLGARAVLLKGGHARGSESVDYLAADGRVHELRMPRIAGPGARGTGCTLATVLAVGLAEGRPLLDATWRAKRFVHAALRAARTPSERAPLDVAAGARSTLSPPASEE